MKTITLCAFSTTVFLSVLEFSFADPHSPLPSHEDHLGKVYSSYPSSTEIPDDVKEPAPYSDILEAFQKLWDSKEIPDDLKDLPEEFKKLLDDTKIPDDLKDVPEEVKNLLDDTKIPDDLEDIPEEVKNLLDDQDIPDDLKDTPEEFKKLLDFKDIPDDLKYTPEEFKKLWDIPLDLKDFLPEGFSDTYYPGEDLPAIKDGQTYPDFYVPDSSSSEYDAKTTSSKVVTPSVTPTPSGKTTFTTSTRSASATPSKSHPSY